MTTVRSVESFPIDSVKGVELPVEVYGLPFASEQLQRLLESFPAVTALPENTERNDEPLDYLPFYEPSPEISEYELRQPSPYHGRSFQLVGPQFEQQWQDEYGNNYGALTFKGNNYSKPGIIKSPTAAVGYIPYGLQESTVIERVVRASEVLRSRGISTEYILGLAEPKMLPWPIKGDEVGACEYVSLAEYKRRITEDYWHKLTEEEREATPYIELFSKFQDTAFYTSLRATDTPYRVLDLVDRTIRQKVYDHVNQEHPDHPFEVSNANDDERFLRDVIAPNLGRNLAKLHVDLAHRFPHLGNITALGGIVDLDSVHGEGLGLGDAPVTMADRAYDLHYLTGEMPQTLPGVSLRIYHQLDAHFSFTSSYLHETFKAFDSEQAAIEHIGALIVSFEALVDAKENSDDSIGGFVLRHLKHVYVEDILGIAVEDADIAKKLYAEVRQYIETEWDTLKAEGMQHLQTKLPGMCSDIINDHINEITSAHYSGEAYDPLNQTDTRQESIALWSANLIDFFIDKLGDELAKNNQSIEKVRSLPHVETRAMIYRQLLELFAEEFHETGMRIATAFINERLQIIRDELAYTYPDQLFGDEATHSSHTGFHDKQFWHFGDTIPWQQVEFLIESGQMPIVYEQLTYAEHGEPIIKPSTPDATIVEVVTDSSYECFIFDRDQNREPFIAPSFSRPPSYIGIVEQPKKGGDRTLRILGEYEKDSPDQLRLF